MLRAGVDLGGTKIQVAIVDEKNNVLGTDRRPTPTTGTPDGVTDAIASSVKGALTNASVGLDRLVGVGVGGPGQIDHAKGTLSNAGNLPGWMITYPLAHQLSKRLVGTPVFLGNDVQVGVNAEVHLGAGREYNSLLGVFCGTGVGGGLVIDRKIWLGRGAAGEIGHMVVDGNKKAARCTCGRRGCMEAYAGRAAMEIQARKWKKKGKKTDLFKIMKKKDKPRLASGVWDTALKQNDKMAHKLIDRAIWALGCGVASAVNLTDVDAVIIGGGLGIRLGEPFVDQIREAMMPHLLKAKNPPAILLAELGDMGGAIGAALLVEPAAKALEVQKASARATAKKAPTAAKKAAKKAPVRKAPAKRAAPRKAPAKKAPVTTAAELAAATAQNVTDTVRGALTKRAPAKRTTAKRTTATKSAAKKATPGT